MKTLWLDNLDSYGWALALNSISSNEGFMEPNTKVAVIATGTSYTRIPIGKPTYKRTDLN